MKYEWLDDYCLAKPGAEKDYKPEWDAVRYMIRGKMFVMLGGDKEGRPIITLKLAPMDGLFMRNQYADVIPGYYMNKEHWNSIYFDGEVPDAIVKEMLDQSYSLIFDSLSKKTQKEIVG